MKNILFTGAALAAMITVSPAAMAQGKADRARIAISAAEAKIEAANKVGASGQVPRLQAEAQAALRTAKEDLASGRKDAAIAEANHASELADTAIGESHRTEVDTARADSANAQDAAVVAQQEAAAANARAAAAEQAAASAQQDAAAARAAQPVVVATPVATPAPQPTTTVTTETVRQAATPTATKKVVRQTVKRTARRAPTAVERTTTTVKTEQN